jgi:DNA-binding response OmpR family regulator
MPSPAECTVLIVDDNSDLLALMADSLRLLGHINVVTADNGATGLERYFEVRPDCVIIDIVMPGLDGYQLIHALRGDAASSGTPLVVLSALVQEKQRLAGLLCGADEYVVKPVTPLQLVGVIRQVLARSEEERRARQLALLDEGLALPE